LFHCGSTIGPTGLILRVLVAGTGRERRRQSGPKEKGGIGPCKARPASRDAPLDRSIGCAVQPLRDDCHIRKIGAHPARLRDCEIAPREKSAVTVQVSSRRQGGYCPALRAKTLNRRPRQIIDTVPRSSSGFARWATTGGSAKPNAKDSTKSNPLGTTPAPKVIDPDAAEFFIRPPNCASPKRALAA
jgi:hypothetical protein